MLRMYQSPRALKSALRVINLTLFFGVMRVSSELPCSFICSRKCVQETIGKGGAKLGIKNDPTTSRLCTELKSSAESRALRTIVLATVVKVRRVSLWPIRPFIRSSRWERWTISCSSAYEFL